MRRLLGPGSTWQSTGWTAHPVSSACTVFAMSSAGLISTIEAQVADMTLAGSGRGWRRAGSPMWRLMKPRAESAYFGTRGATLSAERARA